jgi:predicted RNA-binding Zn-ribbon protein involved in translation (DUF1610 family)
MADDQEQLLALATTSIELVDGAKGQFTCPSCEGSVNVRFERFDECRGTIFYECSKCDQTGHVSVRLPRPN